MFLVPVLLLFLFLEFYNQYRSKNEILAKQNLIESKKDDIDLLVVGNSHGRDGINPLTISENGVNACIGGSILYYNKHQLSTYLAELPNCEKVLLNISYQTLFYDMDSLPNAQKKYEFYHYTGAAYQLERFNFSRYSLLYAMSIKGAINNVIKDFKGGGIDYEKFNGYGGASSTNSNPTEKACKDRAEQHLTLMNKNMLDENLSYLKDIASLVKEQNKDLILITVPVSPSYRKHLKDPLNQYTRILKHFADNNGIQYLDYSSDHNFNMNHFRDPDHLNRIGGELFSKELKKALDL